MLRTINPQVSLWESILPDVALRMPAELESVDALLDDPGVLRALPEVLRPDLGKTAHSDRDLPADDVPEDRSPIGADRARGTRRGGLTRRRTPLSRGSGGWLVRCLDAPQG